VDLRHPPVDGFRRIGQAATPTSPVLRSGDYALESKKLAYLEGLQYDDTIIVALGIGSAFSFGEEKFVPGSCHCSD
jgi:hypothetical protein